MLSTMQASSTERNWLKTGGDKKRAKISASETYKQNKKPWWEVENPASRDGIYFDKKHQTYEVRQFGKPSKPVSGRPFYNHLNGMNETYDDVTQPPVYSCVARVF